MRKIFDNWEEFGVGLAQLVARAWLEPEFERAVVENPKKALASVGLSVGDNVEIEIDRGNAFWSVQAPIEREGKVVAVLRLPMPHRPVSLTDEDLRQIVQGSSGSPYVLGGCICFC